VEETEPRAFTPARVMTAEEAAQTDHMLNLNSKEIVDNTPLEKLHWFSNLSDALKRSNIDND